jgi:hypothetical protein
MFETFVVCRLIKESLSEEAIKGLNNNADEFIDTASFGM